MEVPGDFGDLILESDFVLSTRTPFEEVPGDFGDLIGMESDASFPGLLVVWFQFYSKRIENVSHCKKQSKYENGTHDCH